MLYPLDKDCDTEPLITIANITIRNVTSEGGLLAPGIIRCHESNPCTGINFEDVHLTQHCDIIDCNFIVENAEGTHTNVTPDPYDQGCNLNERTYEEGNPIKVYFLDPLSSLYAVGYRMIDAWCKIVVQQYHTYGDFMLDPTATDNIFKWARETPFTRSFDLV